MGFLSRRNLVAQNGRAAFLDVIVKRAAESTTTVPGIFSPVVFGMR